MLTVQTIVQVQQDTSVELVMEAVAVHTAQRTVILLMVGTTLQKRNGLTWMFVERKNN
jgi:hypothetical protein